MDDKRPCDFNRCDAPATITHEGPYGPEYLCLRHGYVFLPCRGPLHVITDDGCAHGCHAA